MSTSKSISKERSAEKADDRGDTLRASPMMAHLLDALEAGTDVGHYGRLTFVMIARHFIDEEEMVNLLARQPDQDETTARALVMQVKAKDYSPPKRDRILQWQAQQDFPIVPNPDDPDSGNVYRELRFPDDVYENINEYYQEKAVEAAD
jgi:hypothetical protein